MLSVLNTRPGHRSLELLILVLTDGSRAQLHSDQEPRVLICASAHEFDARRRMISKNFHHVLRVSERQPLVGPPESMREHVVAACKAMKVGDWRACHNFIVNDKMNAKVSLHNESITSACNTPCS